MDHTSHRWWKREEWNHPLPVALPHCPNRTILFIPLLPKLAQFVLGGFCGRCIVNSFQIRSHLLAFFVSDILQTVADQVHNAQLDLSLGENSFDRVRKTFQPIDTNNEDVLNAPV